VSADPQAEVTASLAHFSTWLEAYRSAAPDKRRAQLDEGLRLARARRPAMAALIESDPEEALRQAVSLEDYESLPAELRAEVEEPFSALANVRVLPVCVAPEQRGVRGDAIIRLTEIADRDALHSYVFGRRAALDTKENSPVQGIRLGTAAALRAEVFQPLDPREIAAAEAKYPNANPRADRCFATGHPLGTDTITALSGGKIFRFENTSVLADFDRTIASLDTRPGPQSGASVIFLPMPATATGAFDLGSAIARSDLQASTWTETKKRVFMIRADFSDKPNATFPVTNDTSYASLLNTTVSDRVREFSYGKTWIEATVSNQVTRLPRTAASYAAIVSAGSSDNSALLADARTAYRAINGPTSLDGYDIVGVWFVSIGMLGSGLSYAGLAGGSDLWIQGNTDGGVHVHEFGHNYGLGHASFWVPPALSTNPLDPTGANDEYGDPFDVMGNGPLPDAHFHSEAKQRLNWLTAGEWTDATAGGSGTYRIHRVDNQNTTGVRGLRVTRGADDYLWVGHRRSFANGWLKAGAYIVWKRPGQGRSWFVDFTPGSTTPSSNDRRDGALAIGRTYSDTAANVFITPIARGGTSPNEYLDVRVNLGPFPGNAAPTATIGGPSTIGARQSVIFTAQASDTNGDALAYAWDFGSGFTFDNNPSAATAWNYGGTYTVTLTVSDMKGGSVTTTKSVTVVDPLTTWTDRANTSVGDFRALAASPTHVLAVGEDYSTFRGPAALSADGATWSNGTLGLNQQGFGAVWDGAQFIIAGMDYDFGISAFVGCILTSPSGTGWTRRLYSGKPLRGLTVGGGVRVAVGEGGHIRRSLDGVTWTDIPSGTTRTLEGIAYGGGRFVATGYDGAGSGNVVVLTSPDGLSWTNVSAGAGVESWQDLREIVWAQDRFVSSGWYAKLRTSVDLGVSFQNVTANAVDAPALAFGNGVYFAAGRDRDASGAHVDLISIDGANWIQQPAPVTQERRAAIFFQGTFITVGDSHSIRQSGAIAPAAAGYVAWRETYFPDRDAASTPGSDGDLDTLANLYEYGAGLNPLTAGGSNGAAAAPQLVRELGHPNLADRIALRFSLPEPAAADLLYTIEAASSLTGVWTTIATKTGTGAWAWNADGASRIVLATPSGGRQQVTVGDSQPITTSSPRFLKLRVSINQ
jgi:PKD repeat protein